MQVGFTGLLFLLLLGLKLGGAITWSWLWITSPLWLPLLIAVIFIVAICVGIACDCVTVKGGANVKKS